MEDNGASLAGTGLASPKGPEPDKPSPPIGGIPSAAPRQMRMQWSTDAGYVMLFYPSDLSLQDVGDVQELLDLAVQGMERRALAMNADAPEPQPLSPPTQESDDG